MNDRDPKARSRGVSADMSGAAIARRLEILAELDELARQLLRARREVPGDGFREDGAPYRPGPEGDGDGPR